VIRKLQPICIGLSTFLIVLSYAINQFWIASLLITILGILWMVGYLKGWKWQASVMFTLFIGASAIGLWLNLSQWLILLSMVGAISAWDLDHFTQRMRYAGLVVERPNLEKYHIKRLLVVNLFGLFLSVIALNVEVKLGFGTILLLGMIAVLGLNQVIIFLKGKSS
jgi:hypothetical protein